MPPSPLGKSWILHWCTAEAVTSTPHCTSSSREEEQRTADPANKGSIGGACQEGSLLGAEGGHNVEPGLTACTRAPKDGVYEVL